MIEHRTPNRRSLRLGQPRVGGWGSRFCLHARTWVKRVLLGAYCHGLLPSWAVRIGFRVLHLRRL